MNKYETVQEEFWAGDFGDDYICRNEGEKLLASNLKLFSKALNQAGKLSSCLELGANIGNNLRALKLLYPEVALSAIEINHTAANRLRELIGSKNVFEGSAFEYPIEEQVDLILIKTVLIHINPTKLNAIYEKIYRISSRYILICEYYNPTAMSVTYRGHQDRLFKRDFAGDLLDTYTDLRLLDYGFSYHRDPVFPQDDITWFLLKKE